MMVLTHPNGVIYARCFLESFAKARPDFLPLENISDERFTYMIVMPDDAVLGFCSNQQMSEEKLRELAKAMVPVGMK